MPTRPTKGSSGEHDSHGHAGPTPQKAVTGSGRSPEVIDEAREAMYDDHTPGSPGSPPAGTTKRSAEGEADQA